MTHQSAPSRLTLGHVEHGVAIPARSTDCLPAAKATVEALGIRMTYLGWPGLTQTDEGDLLVSGSEHVLHVDPFGRDLVARSSDGGRTWSEPEVVFDSVTDDRDMALNRLPDGTIVATWFSSDVWARPKPFPWMRPEWESLREWMKPDTLKAMHRGWLRRSTDGGRTWERLIHPTLVGQHAGPTPLSDGGLLYLGRYEVEDGSKMVATRSDDGGRTWRIISELPVPRFFDEVTQKHWSAMGENHVVETRSGHLVAAFRGSPECTTPNVHVARSNDNGITWSETQDTGAFGHPPYLLRLKSGVLVCLFSQRGEPARIAAMFSYDEGASWDVDHILTLAESPAASGIDMGYPVAVETEPNELFCVYYSSPTLKAEDYAALDPAEYGIRSARIQFVSAPAGATASA